MSKKVKSTATTQSQMVAQKQQTLDDQSEESMQGSVSGTIWAEIKDKNIEMFALPNQKVNMHCHPVTIEPSKLYLLTNSSAVLPSLEAAIGSAYVVELADKFVIVSRAVNSLTKK